MEVRAEKVTEESGQTDMKWWVSPHMCGYHAATDTFVYDLTSNVPAMKSPQTTAEAATVVIPIPHQMARDASSRGCKITSIELYYDLDVAGTAASASIYKTTLQADGTIPSAAEVTNTCDHTEAQLYSADEHKVTLTPSTPAFIDDNEAWHVELSITKAATTDFTFYGALINWTRAL